MHRCDRTVIVSRCMYMGGERHRQGRRICACSLRLDPRHILYCCSYMGMTSAHIYGCGIVGDCRTLRSMSLPYATCYPFLTDLVRECQSSHNYERCLGDRERIIMAAQNCLLSNYYFFSCPFLSPSPLASSPALL